MVRKLISTLFLSVFLAGVGVVALPQTSHAAIAPKCQKGKFLGLPYWYQYQDVVYEDRSDDKIDNGSCSVKFDGNNPAKVASGIGLALFEILLRIGGLVAVVFVVVGGFQFITSQGEPERAKNARGTILNAIIGLAITLVAAPLVSFIATRISSSGGGTP